MEIHKPKPIHSWREFLSEVGIIVIGVAIALAGEQTVEALHNHSRAAEARASVRQEIARNLANMNYRLGVYVLRSAQMPKKDEPAGAGWYHTNIAEAYYFLRGTGTFAIGGTLENPVADDPNAWSTKMVRGPSVSGTFKGATELKFGPGDIIIAPTGVPHRPSQILSVPRDIMRIAIDPDKVLPLK